MAGVNLLSNLLKVCIMKMRIMIVPFALLLLVTRKLLNNYLLKIYFFFFLI